MSPVTPAAVARASLAGISSLLSIASGPPSGYSFALPEVVEFNGSITHLPPPSGPVRVGVHDFVVEDDNKERRHFSPLCGNSTEAQLREAFGENGAVYYREACEGPRHIPASMFYPTCGSREGSTKFGPVFTPSLLTIIQDQVFGSPKAIHNLLSQAVKDSPVCADTYSMIMLTPPVGGQRQAYTEIATELASNGMVVVTVDHSLLSGVVEVDDNIILSNLGLEMILSREAVNTYIFDIAAVQKQLTNKTHMMNWNGMLGTEIDPNSTCVLGHGTGGLAAQTMVANNMVPCGGRLHRRLIPAPYTDEDVFHQAGFSQAANPVVDEYELGRELTNVTGALSQVLGERLRNMANGLRKTMMDSLSSLICRVVGTCGTLVQKRG